MNEQASNNAVQVKMSIIAAALELGRQHMNRCYLTVMTNQNSLESGINIFNGGLVDHLHETNQEGIYIINLSVGGNSVRDWHIDDAGYITGAVRSSGKHSMMKFNISQIYQIICPDSSIPVYTNPAPFIPQVDTYTEEDAQAGVAAERSEDAVTGQDGNVVNVKFGSKAVH